MMLNEKKSVSFAPEGSIATVYLIHPCECGATTSADFENAKKNALEDAAKARNEDLDEILDGTFTNPHADVQKRLNQLVRNSDYRGLERYICRSHYIERKTQRDNAIKAVLIGQEMAKKQGMSPDEISTQLRKVALVYCINAKVFARRMGKADEAACYPKKSSSGSSVRCKPAHPMSSFQKTYSYRLNTARMPLKV